MKTASKKNLLRLIFWNKKIFIATRVNFCFQDERSKKSMNFIMPSLIVAIVTMNSCTDKALRKKACALRGETCKKIFLQGQNDSSLCRNGSGSFD